MRGFLQSEGARTGLYFGATSGVITTLGLITGLHAGTSSLTAVLGGILVIAFADAMSDALGIHIAEEADPETDTAHVWAATLSTFATKFVFALSFAVPLLFMSLTLAVYTSIAWGMLVITLLSFLLARAQGSNPVPVVAEHLVIASVVVVLSHLIGRWVGHAFG